MEVLAHVVLPCETLQLRIFAPIYSAVSTAENAPYEPSGAVFEVQDAGFKAIRWCPSASL